MIVGRLMHEVTSIRNLVQFVLAACIVVSARCQQPPSAEAPAFEVAAIKPTATGSTMSVVWFGDIDVVKETNVTVATIVSFAYNLKDGELKGGPAWIGSDRYDLFAKVPDSYVKEFQSDRSRAGEEHRIGQLRLMMRSLLADRFHLVVSSRTEAIPVFVLTVAKGGPKLQAATGRFGMSSAGTELAAYGVGISSFADELSKRLSRRVIDDTRLKDRYDIDLSWRMDPSVYSGSPEPLDVLLARAVEEQLGLKLEVRKTPVLVLNVESVQRPSAN